MNRLVVIFLFLVWQKADDGFCGRSTDYHIGQEEVEVILGQSANLSFQKDSTGVARYYRKNSRAYIAYIQDYNRLKISGLNYIFEEFSSEDEAFLKLNAFMESNKYDAGYEAFKVRGGEGFFKTDAHNFAVWVGRKAKVLIYLKVNKLTFKTNLDAMKNTGKSILERV